MLDTINEMERHIAWADKLLDVIRIEVKEVGCICKITDEDITKWKEWAREHEFIEEKKEA